MVGAILGDRAAGLYGAAAKTASLVGLILVAVNAIGAPMFSVLFAQNRQKDLQQLVSAIAAWAFWPSCLLSIVLATCAPLVLTIFGPAFASAEWQLRVLLVGQIVNAAAGRSGGSYCYQAVRTLPPGSTDGLRLSTSFSSPS
jgi:O-antigen/teichoic acid export membrane protein